MGKDVVCLRCWYLFRGRKEEPEQRSCTVCRSRIIIPFNTLIKAIEGAAEWTNAHQDLRLLDGPLIVLAYVPWLTEILGKTPFPHGIEIINEILAMGRNFNRNGTLTLEEYVLIEIKRRHDKKAM